MNFVKFHNNMLNSFANNNIYSYIYNNQVTSIFYITIGQLTFFYGQDTKRNGYYFSCAFFI